MSERKYSGYVIVDLDGCLSDDRWRRKKLPDYSPKTQEAWDEYHAGILHDDVVRSVVGKIVDSAFDAHRIQRSLVLVVTARPMRGRVEANTRSWLVTYLHGIEWRLFMRPGDSLLHAAALKMKLLNDYFASVHGEPWEGWRAVVAAFDDRQDILDSYPIPESARVLCELPELETHTEGIYFGAASSVVAAAKERAAAERRGAAINLIAAHLQATNETTMKIIEAALK